MAVEDLGPAIGDNPDGMAEIAAAMDSLDLVVTPNSAIAHLAGTLGRPVWVALMADPDWRWLRTGEASPWYPTMRLFRQPDAGDWSAVIEAMAKALKERTGAVDRVRLTRTGRTPRPPDNPTVLSSFN